MPHWPAEHGGTGWTLVQRYLFEAECARAGAPTHNGAGAHMVGPVIMHYGTPEQKRKYLPRIVSGEDCWAQGYSEPGSGSDLASLRTRGVRDGDHYIINGQKVWTSRAMHSDMMLLLARTTSADQVRKRSDGLSVFLVDMREMNQGKGLEVRQIGRAHV